MMSTIKHALHEAFRWFANHTYKYWPDGLWLRMLFYTKVHKKLNLSHPKTFTDKLNWQKIHDRNPLYTKLVDKYEVKAYIKDLIGEQYVIPLYGVWNHFDDIDFDQLPEQFILKCTHDSGRFAICKDKSSFDKQAVKERFEKSLHNNFFWWTREWAYKNVPPRIIAEKLMDEDGSGALTDYKFFCFNGEPRIMYISKDVAAHPTTDFFDMDWNPLPFKIKDEHSDVLPPKPPFFEDMRCLARKLSQGIPQVRVDFYYIKGQIYFGEMTFYHNSGIFSITPDEWDSIIGEWLEL